VREAATSTGTGASASRPLKPFWRCCPWLVMTSTTPVRTMPTSSRPRNFRSFLIRAPAAGAAADRGANWRGLPQPAASRPRAPGGRRVPGETDDRLQVGKAREREHVLRLEQGLLDGEHGGEVDGAAAQALLGDVERAARAHDRGALQPLLPGGLLDRDQRLVDV